MALTVEIVGFDGEDAHAIASFRSRVPGREG